ncbi:SRPBCC family protein [Paenibacillus sp. 1001270B_150601_E10]|uniref:SRPBCC family protein n=1 Tax=Paenibacillus sp. 1001270B_150601_E10 TaxID=2787079 RepID=UPI00189ED8EF|nr:SRPBCC family protein [Paenibacillus sp. 1001270B_150601_E10]
MNWKERMDIEANIETIWRLFDWDNQQRIMPQVVENKLIEETEGKIGTKFQQKYKEGKRVETYIVEVLEYEDTPAYKHLKVGFTLAKTFNIRAAYTLHKKDEHHTVFEYSGSNEGINLFGKIMLKLGSTKGNQKVVTDFMKRVQQEALKDERNAV